MKKNKRLVIILLVSCMFSMLTFQSTYAAANKPVLKKGTTSQEVTSLQKDLSVLGYMEHKPTGYYGSLTEEVVKKFQNEHGINPTGIVGQETYKKIDYLIKRPVLKKGIQNNEVSSLQKDLGKLGFMTQEPTGFFGVITETAVADFQKKYALKSNGVADLYTYEKIDNLLSGLKNISIVIDPGHGGIDIGTSKGKLIESEINLDISKKLEKALNEDDFKTILTRTKDVSLDSLFNGSGTRQLKDLRARTNIINRSNADFFVSIHVNSTPTAPSNTGSIVYYDDKLPESKLLAQNIQNALNSFLAGNGSRTERDSQTADFYVLRKTNVPGVLVETAYITNAGERRLLATDTFRTKIGKAIAAGIIRTCLK